jgi:hypothetical protein
MHIHANMCENTYKVRDGAGEEQNDPPPYVERFMHHLGPYIVDS